MLNILTVNVGISTIRFKIFAISKNSKLNLLLSGQIAELGSKISSLTIHNMIKNVSVNEDLKLGSDCYTEAIQYLVKHKKFNQFHCHVIINRIIHGGHDYKGITLLHKKTLAYLTQYNQLATSHPSYNLLIADFLMQHLPKARHYACFDTSFHQNISTLNKVYPIPLQYSESGVRRYGAHGLSFQYLTDRLDAVVEHKLARQKWVLVHLGSSSSVCAIRNKKSVATSTGFTLAAGIPLPSSGGELDPLIPEYLMNHFKLSVSQVKDILINKSGLLGLSNGLSSDMKTLLLSDDKHAKFAVDFYCLQVAGYIVKAATTNQGIDGLVFSGAIGEKSAIIRTKIIDSLAWIGLALSKKANNSNKVKIHKKTSKIPILVIETNEELAMLNDFLSRSSL